MRPVGEPVKRVSEVHMIPNLSQLTFVLVVVLVRRLVDDGAVLETSKIKHAHTTVSTAADEDINTSSAKSYVKYLLVVRNQLGLGCECWNVPYCAGCVYTGRNDELW